MHVYLSHVYDVKDISLCPEVKLPLVPHLFAPKFIGTMQYPHTPYRLLL
jgi:hypothetical protein